MATGMIDALRSSFAWKKRIQEGKEVDPDPEPAPPQPAASAPPGVRFTKQYTPEERLRQQKALAEALRKRAP